MSEKHTDQWFIEPGQFMMVIMKEGSGERYIYGNSIVPYQTVEDAITFLAKRHNIAYDNIESIWRVDLPERMIEDVTPAIAHVWVGLHDKRVRRDVPTFVRETDVWEEYEAYLDARMGDDI